jgi:hypothetical protein
MNEELHAVICHVYDETTLLDRLEIDMETLVTILTPQIEERLNDIQDDLSEAGAYDGL